MDFDRHVLSFEMRCLEEDEAAGVLAAVAVLLVLLPLDGFRRWPLLLFVLLGFGP